MVISGCGHEQNDDLFDDALVNKANITNSPGDASVSKAKIIISLGDASVSKAKTTKLTW